MDLVQQAMDATGVDETQAKVGVGLVLFAIRFGTEQNTFDAIKSAYADTQTLFTAALSQGGRTAEMLAVANPPAIRKRLEAAGFTGDTLGSLGAAVTGALEGALPDEMMSGVRQAVEGVTG